ncbi:hypothetical protein BGX38DRAFT_1143626 [Terfezia claveryi]|nr:hypothetical protein BGX38DRAFT_1143626 [Terfezia claveryi]
MPSFHTLNPTSFGRPKGFPASDSVQTNHPTLPNHLMLVPCRMITFIYGGKESIREAKPQVNIRTVRRRNRANDDNPGNYTDDEAEDDESKDGGDDNNDGEDTEDNDVTAEDINDYLQHENTSTEDNGDEVAEDEDGAELRARGYCLSVRCLFSSPWYALAHFGSFRLSAVQLGHDPEPMGLVSDGYTS